jgi:3-oxoacyl-(acyl-carrier-protein) synthase
VKVGVSGIGCVTPLAESPAGVWEAIRAGKRITSAEVRHPETGRLYHCAPVPAAYTAPLAREARLRRSSAISLIGATAAKQAIENSGGSWAAVEGRRMAIVFAVSSGGVQYTRRFYEQVVKQGANVASPMLFPETVYNAPASHVAALLGIDGATYTLVGDGTVGLQALEFGGQLLALGEAEEVLVVGAEELDWILLEAHRNWRLTAEGSRPGAILAEGAAAVVLTNDASNVSVKTSPGQSFTSMREAAGAMEAAVRSHEDSGRLDLVISGANETWADELIEDALRQHAPAAGVPIVTPKLQLGEALGAGALLQVVLGASAIQARQVNRALVASLGWNQQAAAALIERTD